MNTALHVKCPLLLSALKKKKPVFYRHIFEKYSNVKFHENPSIGAQLLHADRQDEAYSRFSQMSELHLQMITKRIMKIPYIIHKTYARNSTLGFKWSIPQDYETLQGNVRRVSVFTGPSK